LVKLQPGGNRFTGLIALIFDESPSPEKKPPGESRSTIVFWATPKDGEREDVRNR
jgi:hypothetical protein